MDTFNYSLLRINFNLQSNGKCLNNKTLEPETCEYKNTLPKYKFEKVTLGNGKYVLMDYTSQTCLQTNNTMGNFNVGECKVFNKINSRYNYNEYSIKNMSFNSKIYSCSSTKDTISTYTPDLVPNNTPITVPTLPVGYVLPFKGNTLYKK